VAAVKRTLLAGFGLFFFLLFSPFQFAHHLWCRYVLGQAVSLSFRMETEVYAEVLATLEEALRTLMPEAVEVKREVHVLTPGQILSVSETAGVALDPETDREFYFFIGRSRDGEITGYVGADSVLGKWGRIHYMLLLDAAGTVKDVIVLEYQEKRGRPVARKRFLKQFFGKTAADEISLRKDIRGVTGASISSRGMTDGIRKMVHLFHELYLNGEKA